MATAGEPIKFRCFQCSTKLKVNHSKSGSVVACPRCGTELIVPDGDDDVPAGEVDPGAAQMLHNMVTTGPPPAPAPPLPPSPEGEAPFLGIVVEAETGLREKRRHATPPHPAPAPVAPAPVPPSPRPPSSNESPVFEVVRTERVAATAIPGPAPAAFPVAAAEPLAIRPEAMALRPERHAGPRRNDVALPRTAVVLWSFLVLVAVVFAFAAGLLLGHFVWAQPPAQAPAMAAPESPKAAPAAKPGGAGARMP